MLFGVVFGACFPFEKEDVSIQKPIKVVAGKKIKDEYGERFVTEEGNYPLLNGDYLANSSENQAVYKLMSKEELLDKYPGLELREALEEYTKDVFKFLYGARINEETSEFEFAEVDTYDEFFDAILDDNVSDVIRITYEDEEKGEIVLSIEEVERLINSGDAETAFDELVEIYTQFKAMEDALLNGIESSSENLKINFKIENMKGNELVTYFTQFCAALYNANDKLFISKTLKEFEDNMMSFLYRLELYNNQIDVKDFDKISDYIYALIDEVNKYLGATSLSDEFEVIHKRELPNIRQIAEEYDRVRIECGDIKINEQQNKPKEEIKKVVKNINMKEMRAFLDKKISGQNEAKRTVISELKKYYRSEDKTKAKPGFFLVGPTGCGKTLIAETTAEYLGLPTLKIDMGQLSQTGYVGKNIEDFLTRLLEKTNGDVEAAQNAIVILDEADKKGTEKNDDVSGRAVLNEFLTFIQGEVYEVKYKSKTVYFDTSNLIIFATGAFAEAAKKKYEKENQGKDYDDRPYHSSNIGFNATLKSKSDTDKKMRMMKYPRLEPLDLIELGNMPDEFIGRQKIILQIDNLSKPALKNILHLESSPLLAEIDALAKDEITLDYENSDFEDRICDKALEYGTGARALESLVKTALSQVSYFALSFDEPVIVKVNGDTVDDPYNCMIIVKSTGEQYYIRDLKDEEDSYYETLEESPKTKLLN